MYIINITKEKKAKPFSRLTFFCALFIFITVSACSSQEEDKQEKSEQNLSAQHLTKTTIPIEGMTCNSCVARIKSKLKSIEALQVVEVSLQHRKVTVFYEEGDITPQQVQQSINELGYKAGEPVTEGSK